ncbi:MAG: penicillin-binding protein activator [Thiocapsa sp.]|uniref:penicillin-binding protein activator n=1 Tax=Thiocapsa sp. TaxID=2024551 RepID=UPI001BCF3581|nr:penicillin-binding protein activator [Thiocapsa sp.]QVL46825.1 MAG: penicillin-binding protein activator [Thiocapsa sp.]
MPKNRVDRRPLSTSITVIALLAAVSLAGCAIDPVRDEARLLAPVAGEPLRQADALAAQGQADAAAKAYLDIAKGATPPAREQLQLKAARAYLSAGDTRQAQQTIGEVSRPALTIGQREQLLLIEADLALLDGRPKDAISRLESMQVQTLPKDLKIQRLGTLAAAQRLANDPVASAESLSALDRLLDNEDARLLNQVSLITTLSALSSEELRTLARGGSGTPKGWAEIALLAHDAGADPATFLTRYRQEHSRRLGHPAHPRLAEAYVKFLSGGYASGDSVSVMLPRGGRFAGAATSVKEGIEAAGRADSSGNRPTLDFIDSSQTERARALHAKAVEAGADYVIGPLAKESVDSLAAGPALAVPTLALNQTTRDSQPAANLFQFSLSPENEAAEVANKAAAMGLKRAAVLYPEGPWGARLASAFRNQWRRLGGTLEAEAVYNPTARSFEKTVATLLGDSQADVLFLVATNELAHKLYPQIRLSRSSVTVMSTSHVYSGVFDPARDRVLAGLYFVDIPWMLNSRAEGALSRRRLSGSSFEVANPLARLYAMGIDAYRIAPRLPALAKSPGAFYPGQTGGLSVDSLGRIQRQLALGRFGETGVLEAGERSDTPASETL